MNLDAAPTASIAASLPKGVLLTRAVTVTAGLGLHGMGLYAAVVTFGAWVTVGLDAVGGLAIVLQHIALGRTPCSSGD